MKNIHIVNQHARILRIIIIAVIMAIAGFAGISAQAEEAHAASWHDVTLSNGQVYDVSTAKANTTVYINSAGTFTLTGQSSKVRIVVNSTDATIYLANGLEITPGALANVGQRTAAITINDQGGTVRLITKKNANVTFENYLGTAAIEKEGTNTKLIFNTEDDKAPGTITATASTLSNSAGIGSSAKGLVARNIWTGNMEFNGGKIVATGGGWGAGIGGSTVGHVNGITINGSTIIATGGADAAGIGGGYRGNARNIHIISGDVTAIAGNNGAGIGSGQSDELHSLRTYAQNITIDGGTVYARGDRCGAGIGGGDEADVKGIYINGGSVTAIGGDLCGTGIGAGGGNHQGTASEIWITNGLVVATGQGDGATGIGSSSAGDGTTSIYITGGNVTVTGGENGVGIGGGGLSNLVDGEGTTFVKITGGTVKVNGNTSVDIGSQRNSDSTVIITGGSINADTTKQPAINEGGIRVYKTVIKLDGLPGDSMITSAQMKELSQTYSGYGLNDVYTQNGYLYFWLPEGVSVEEAVIDEMDSPKYVGSVTAGSSGILYLKEPEYQIYFDPNVPENTASQVTGTMENQHFTGDEVQALTSCGYILKGYEFTGWNTAADGSGTSYADGQTVGDLTNKDDSVITLYAQWKPVEYKVHFKDGNGNVTEQTMTYDESTQLAANSFAAPKGMRFAGWKRTYALGASLYADQATVVNLCGYNADENRIVEYTMEAQWVSADIATIVVTLNNEPYTLPKGELKISGGTLEYEFKMTEAGVYTSSQQDQLAAGVYKIYRDTEDTGRTLTVGNGQNFAQLDYYSVTVSCDEKLDADSLQGTVSEILAGNTVKISVKAKADSGYVFDKWVVLGAAPAKGWNKNAASTEIRIMGETKMKAVSRPVEYTVKFDANKPSDTVAEVEGQMKDQVCVYDKSVLNACEYAIAGYEFKGWSLDKDGGQLIDCTTAANLTTEDGKTVTVYAQWTALSDGYGGTDPDEPGLYPDPEVPTDPDDPSEPANPDGSTDSTNQNGTAKTGDQSYLLYLILIAGAAAAMAAVRRKKVR